jgi:hypothetical protein
MYYLFPVTFNSIKRRALMQVPVDSESVGQSIDRSILTSDAKQQISELVVFVENRQLHRTISWLCPGMLLVNTRMLLEAVIYYTYTTFIPGACVDNVTYMEHVCGVQRLMSTEQYFLNTNVRIEYVLIALREVRKNMRRYRNMNVGEFKRAFNKNYTGILQVEPPQKILPVVIDVKERIKYVCNDVINYKPNVKNVLCSEDISGQINVMLLRQGKPINMNYLSSHTYFMAVCKHNKGATLKYLFDTIDRNKIRFMINYIAILEEMYKNASNAYFAEYL